MNIKDVIETEELNEEAEKVEKSEDAADIYKTVWGNPSHKKEVALYL